MLPAPLFNPRCAESERANGLKGRTGGTGRSLKGPTARSLSAHHPARSVLNPMSSKGVGSNPMCPQSVARLETMSRQSLARLEPNVPTKRPLEAGEARAGQRRPFTSISSAALRRSPQAGHLPSSALNTGPHWAELPLTAPHSAHKAGRRLPARDAGCAGSQRGPFTSIQRPFTSIEPSPKIALLSVCRLETVFSKLPSSGSAG